MDNNIKNTERFSSKGEILPSPPTSFDWCARYLIICTTTVADYVAFRPSYPDGLFTVLSKKYPALNEPGAVIADVGSGTGILTVQLLKAFPHATVYAVEPNEAMRKAAEEFVPYTLGTSERFVSTNGTAEDTTLSNGVADLIIAGTAAHWFDTEGTKKEWQRVLKPGAGAAFPWNTRMNQDIVCKRKGIIHPCLRQLLTVMPFGFSGASQLGRSKSKSCESTTSSYKVSKVSLRHTQMLGRR